MANRVPFNTWLAPKIKCKHQKTFDPCPFSPVLVMIFVQLPPTRSWPNLRDQNINKILRFTPYNQQFDVMTNRKISRPNFGPFRYGHTMLCLMYLQIAQTERHCTKEEQIHLFNLQVVQHASTSRNFCTNLRMWREILWHEGWLPIDFPYPWPSGWNKSRWSYRSLQLFRPHIGFFKNEMWWSYYHQMKNV